MAVIIDLADYRDVTPKADEIRLPEDGFYLKAMQHCGEDAQPASLVIAHSWLTLAAMRGSAKARAERIRVSQRMDSAHVVAAQRAVGDYLARRAIM